MQLYLTVRPEDTRTASAYPAGLAHAAYRIGERSSLLSRNLLTPARSGPMAPLPGLLGGPVGLWNHVLHLLQRPFKRACPYKCQKNPGENTK